MKIFILEDNQDRISLFREKLKGHDLTIAETAQEAINALGTNKNAMTRESHFDLIFLDHDLGGEEMVGTNGANTGSEVVRWMAQEMGSGPSIIVHSMNAPAALEMQEKLRDVGFYCHRVPFINLKSGLEHYGAMMDGDE